MDSYHSSRTKPLYRATQIVWFIMTIVQVLLGMRFLLTLMAANPGAWFSAFIYRITDVLIFPFAHVFANSALGISNIEWNTLLAMFVYWILALGIIRIFFMGKSVSTPEAASKLNNQEKI